MSEWFVVEQLPRQFRARPASAGEVIRTPAGSALAEAGQYVIESDRGDQWVVDLATLEKYFRVAEGVAR
ncbi:MAG: hypothetical protein JOZ99_02595 [Actinobacteria bacterium]|nr:hypothetical protein [Actinomycetota bacterium]